ncbi:MAG: hypothetical protein WA110_02475 [Anaerolineaceae bacterium]
MDKLPFSCSYQVLTSLPAYGQKRFIFPKNHTVLPTDYLVRIIPEHGEEWVGFFGGIDNHYFSGILPWPNDIYICVVSRGVGYVVRIDEPTDYTELPFVPIVHAFWVEKMKITIFATFRDLIAYSRNGVLWKISNLAQDGFTITSLTDTHIKGITTNNFPQNNSFEVCIATGEVTKSE